jgi:hypothetical protein
MSLGGLKKHLGCVAAAAVLAAGLTTSGEAEASGPVQTWGKGTAGGALLGGEIVIIPMGAAGVSRGWPYFVFGGVGMIGGAVGGYFLDKHFAVGTDANGNPTGGPSEPSMAMLAGGLALVIPAVILALNATAYKPPDGDRAEPANNEPSKEPPRPMPAAPPGAAPGGESPPPPTTQNGYRYRSSYRASLASIPHIPTSLLDVYGGKLGFGLPAAKVSPLYSQAEIARFGVTQGTEVQVPVLKAMF